MPLIKRLTLSAIIMLTFLLEAGAPDTDRQVANPSIQAAATKSPLKIDAGSPALHQDNGILYYNGVLFSGSTTQVHANGRYKDRTAYYHGKKHGQRTSWHANGAIRSVRFYQDNRKIGTHKGWWPNGILQYERDFVKGQYHGKNRDWYQDGQLASVRHFNRGKEEGAQRTWSLNGDLFANYVVKDGRRYGLLGAKPCFTVQN